ncbi:MAG TPA: hypothetical protein VGJ45_40945 [Pseudonocardiaceae bacterium]
MSGDERATVQLFGPSMLALVKAIPRIEEVLGRAMVLVGGLAVLSRLGSAYRVTSDVDTANRRADGEPAQLDVLLAHGAKAVDAAGALISTPDGDVRVDVLEISASQLADLPNDPTDRLYLLSHDWAMVTASPLRIQVSDGRAIVAEASVAVARPGPLVATKLQALPNRGSAKEATDLLDIVRLTLDPRVGTMVRTQFAEANSQLRADALLHVRRWFADRADRSLRLIRSTPEGRSIDIDQLTLISELLIASMSG